GLHPPGVAARRRRRGGIGGRGIAPGAVGLVGRLLVAVLLVGVVLVVHQGDRERVAGQLHCTLYHLHGPTVDDHVRLVVVLQVVRRHVDRFLALAEPVEPERARRLVLPRRGAR